MSRGFVREEDQEETPLVTPRAHLPVGVTNYVTPKGLKALKNEREQLTAEQKKLIEDSNDRHRIQINYISAKLQLLNERIISAKKIDLTKQPPHEIHFGATISLCDTLENKTVTYQIVGVDEADISQNKISFLSPIAKALMFKKVGNTIELKTPQSIRIMKIENISYQ